jgi:hypothetical protein
MLMLMVEPFFILLEAALRMHLLSEQYGSFWIALTSDWFFSKGWFGYIETPLGLWYSLFLLAWTALAITLISVAFFSWQLESEGLAREIHAGANQDDGGKG